MKFCIHGVVGANVAPDNSVHGFTLTTSTICTHRLLTLYWKVCKL